MGYPIKYATLELKMNGGSEYNYEDITKGYIVSKCYVVEGRLNYLNDLVKYVVSFPYDDFDSFLWWYKNNSSNYYFDIYKHYNEYRRNPGKELERDEYPHHVVTELFDTYEEARNYVDYLNGCLRGGILNNTGSKEFEILNKEFSDMMEICGEYEKFIFANTNDMKISFEDNINSNDNEIINNKSVRKLKLSK